MKLDATLGLSAGGKLRPMLQIETALAPDGQLYYGIIPSLQIPLGGRRSLVAGAEYRGPGRIIGLKLSLWHDF
jgi:hypothetical protein